MLLTNESRLIFKAVTDLLFVDTVEFNYLH